MSSATESRVQKALAQLVASCGPLLAEQAHRLRGLLADECPGCKREVNALLTALEHKVPAELQASSAGLPWPALAGRLVRRLQEDAAMAEDAARWAVESWALALGRITAQALEPAMARPASPRPVPNVEPGWAPPPVAKLVDQSTRAFGGSSATRTGAGQPPRRPAPLARRPVGLWARAPRWLRLVVVFLPLLSGLAVAASFVLRRGGPDLSQDVAECLRAAASGQASVSKYLKQAGPQRFPVWFAAAKRGSADGQWLVGCCFNAGYGAVKDLTKAVEWYGKSAEQGYAPGQSGLGFMYGEGRGVPKDDAKAVEWYRKSAEQGYAPGQSGLGFMYGEGRGVPKDDAKALEWFRKSAEQGCAIGHYNLGCMYEGGRGVPKDDAAAVGWFRKSAEQGCAPGQNNLGLMYTGGRGVPKDDAKALEWFRKSAEQGFAPGQNSLGFMYMEGRGLHKDDAKAVEWYRKSAEQGCAAGQSSLGYMYAEARGVPKDDAAAVGWFRKSAEQGYASGQFYLGYMHESGRGVQQSVDDALTWYRKAASQGVTLAQTAIDRLTQGK